MNGWRGASVVCAVAAPVVVLAGSGFAAAAEPYRYDPVRQTFSALAKEGAGGRWIMTGTLLALGLGYVVAAAGLPGVRRRGRVMLAAGGAAVALAALLPQPAHGDSTGHLVAAGAGWSAFALWPLAASRGRDDPAVDRWSARGPALVATVVLVGVLAWFTAELVTGGPHLGLAQRVVAVALTAWPLVVALGRSVDRGRTGRVTSCGTGDPAPRRPV